MGKFQGSSGWDSRCVLDTEVLPPITENHAGKNRKFNGQCDYMAFTGCILKLLMPYESWYRSIQRSCRIFHIQCRDRCQYNTCSLAKACY